MALLPKRWWYQQRMGSSFDADRQAGLGERGRVGDIEMSGGELGWVSDIEMGGGESGWVSNIEVSGGVQTRS